ncbi:unnamed protein product [Rhizoctonia solani]|uniref:Glucose-methanol-choline oxidoreductase N-terminal domain-containing protein n=1 Tax=Rhizoctonia solani TaxID=456999 RepID=A0A8H3BPZ4_9AGAM|nr:unnamed protein product [Rhizoctonia solani]
MKKNVIWVLPWFGVAAAVQRTNGADFSSQTFDYVVVGGGTAGLTVAARLSEDPKVSVGVIEAGPYFENDPLVDTPGLAGQLPGNPKYDWMFSSVPQRHVNNRVLPMPRGKALGGSSAINLMALDRASKTEYDAWEDLGNPKWNWNGAALWFVLEPVPNFTSLEFLPYMKAAERFTGIDPFKANATGAGPDDIFPSQGTDGTITASFNTWYSDIVVPFREAMANRGVPINFDPDSGDPFGLYNSATAVNRTTGTRSYAASTYFAYNSGRANFVVLTGAQATKIEFKSPTTGKYGGRLTATGVSFVHDSTTYTVKARKEVILSAGTFQTPHLLELSGIGNATILRQNGIAPLVDLPGVGENLQEHILVPSTYELKPGITTIDILRNNASYAAAAQAQYAATHDGIYSYSTSTLSFINLDYIVNPEELSSMLERLDREVADEEISALQKAQYQIQKDWLKKRHINSTDPLVAPQIDPNYFSKSIGTAALAPKEIGGVVDTSLKVYGTSNVRVADASVIPIHIGTHISRTVYGIGERLAAIITNNSS